MKKISNLLLLALLVLSVAWSQAMPRFESNSTHDLKQLGTYIIGEDLTAEALAAVNAVPGAEVPCTAGVAGPYTCSNVDLLGFVPLAELGGAAGNDSWGWTAEDGTEIAMMGTGRSVAFVDVTDPTNPVVIGQASTPGGETSQADAAIWRDIKVNNDHAYIVSERGGGFQIVDLNEVIANPGTTDTEVPWITFTGEASGPNYLDGFHNLVINEATDTAYLVGVDAHNGRGFIIVDISDAKNPVIRGEVDHGLTTHDAMCTVYYGPDADYNGNYVSPTLGEFDADGDPTNGRQAELCFMFDEDETNIADVSDHDNPYVLTSIVHNPRNGAGSPGVNNNVTGVYSHQGWLTTDHRWLLINDELDELNTRVGATTGGTNTYYVELEDLDAHRVGLTRNTDNSTRIYDGAEVQTYVSPTGLSTDHNMYVKGDYLYQANYAEGLRVIELVTDEDGGNLELVEVGFFDVLPGVNVPGFAGSWNVYPFFDSGTLVLSNLEAGMHLLRFNAPEDGASATPALGLLGQ